MDTKIEKLDDCEDVRAWAHRHQAEVGVEWNQQHLWNRRVEKQLHELTRRITALEKRVVGLAALAAGAGGVIGQVLAAWWRG